MDGSHKFKHGTALLLYRTNDFVKNFQLTANVFYGTIGDNQGRQMLVLDYWQISFQPSTFWGISYFCSWKPFLSTTCIFFLHF